MTHPVFLRLSVSFRPRGVYGESLLATVSACFDGTSGPCLVFHALCISLSAKVGTGVVLPDPCCRLNIVLILGFSCACAREAFGELYAGQAGQMAERMGRLRAKEVAKRDAFLKHVERYMPAPLLAGDSSFWLLDRVWTMPCNHAGLYRACIHCASWSLSVMLACPVPVWGAQIVPCKGIICRSAPFLM